MPLNLIPSLILNVVVTVIWGHDIFRSVRLSVKNNLHALQYGLAKPKWSQLQKSSHMTRLVIAKAVELVRSWKSGNDTDENHFQNNKEKGQSKSDWPFNLALKAL